MPDEDSALRPYMVLCDFAEVINGKLYIQGAGWSRIVAGQPFPLAVAVFWKIPWGKANHKHQIVIKLVTEDGDPFLNPEGEPIRADGQIEVGRPPGLKQGSDLDSPIALKLGPLAFPLGGYRFEFEINGNLEATASFEAVGAL